MATPWTYDVPRCPACGSEDGTLGTSYAYFICDRCGREVYWTADHKHPGPGAANWERAIDASPWGRARRYLERSAGVTPSIEACAAVLKRGFP